MLCWDLHALKIFFKYVFQNYCRKLYDNKYLTCNIVHPPLTPLKLYVWLKCIDGVTTMRTRKRILHTCLYTELINMYKCILYDCIQHLCMVKILLTYLFMWVILWEENTRNERYFVRKDTVYKIRNIQIYKIYVPPPLTKPTLSFQIRRNLYK